MNNAKALKMKEYRENHKRYVLERKLAKKPGDIVTVMFPLGTIPSFANGCEGKVVGSPYSFNPEDGGDKVYAIEMGNGVHVMVFLTEDISNKHNAKYKTWPASRFKECAGMEIGWIK